MRISRIERLLGALLAGLLLASRAAADEPTLVVTHHEISISGHPLAYTAEAGRLAIRDVQTGEPRGYLFYVAYRAPARPGGIRPLTFVWNGGPGVATASLNFEGAGPRRIQDGQMVDNADTWLTDSDLVFMDAMGTGFSRPVSASAQEEFTSNIGDVAAATEFVRAWVLLHGDEETPLIIAGQSYGAGRAGAAAYRLIKRGLNVRGLALISNSQGLPDYPDRALTSLAIHVGDYAVASLYYHRLPAKFGTPPEAARAIAEKWARDTYLPALKRLDQMGDGERVRLTADLAAHIGFDAKDIDPKTVRISQSDFLGHVAPGKLPYYSDYRFIEPYVHPPLQAAIRSIRHELGYASDLPYLSVEPVEDGFAPSGTYPKSVNASWTHSTVYGATAAQLAEADAAFAATGAIGMGQFGPKLPGAAEAIVLQPELRVLVAHGAYDPLGGCSIDAEHGRHMAAPYKAAITYRCYLSGHAIYRDAPARAQFAADMRELARAASGKAR